MTRVDTFCDYPGMKTMGDRLREAREAAKFPSARSAALKYNWKVSTYSAHENGQNQYGEAEAKEYGRRFKVPAGFLLTGDEESSASRITEVPVLDAVPAGKLSAPLSQIADEDIPRTPFADLGNGDFIALTVRGDSMDRISPDGSTILIDRSDRELVAGKAYVFSVRGEVTFKLFRNNPARLQPHSWNGVHEPRFVKSREEAERFVVGRVKRTVLDL